MSKLNLCKEECEDPFADSYDEAEGFPPIRTCLTCSFIYNHNSEYIQKHYPCLCFLLGERSICCLESFRDLINDIPGFKSLYQRNKEIIPNNFNNRIIQYKPYGLVKEREWFWFKQSTSWEDVIYRFCKQAVTEEKKPLNTVFKEKFFKK